MDENFYYIKCYCEDCENPTCRIGEIVKENQGCQRKVSEDLYIRHFHQTKEVWPFYKMFSKEKLITEYEKTMQILDEVYQQPIIKIFGNFHPDDQIII
jgi:hypothetical protein